MEKLRHASYSIKQQRILRVKEETRLLAAQCRGHPLPSGTGLAGRLQRQSQQMGQDSSGLYAGLFHLLTCASYQHHPCRSCPLLSSYYPAPGTGCGLMHQMSSNSLTNSVSWYYNCVCSIDVEGKLRKVKQHAQDHTARKVKSWGLN